MDLFQIALVTLEATIRLSVPLILAALAGLYSERSGVFDIGLEGKMLAAAFAGAASAAVYGSAFIGLTIAVAVSVALALVHAFASITQAAERAHESGEKVHFVFYYSGHSDERALLMGGLRLEYRELKKLIDGVTADVHIAILDSCASGAFTRLKGGHKRPPFLVGDAADVAGHAYLTSAASPTKKGGRL